MCVPSIAASLLSILLVSQSSRGNDLIFSWPIAPTPVPRTSNPIYPKFNTTETQSTYSDSDSEDSDDGSDGSQQGGENEISVGKYLGFSTSVLSSLLIPTRQLSDQPFELVLDNLAFIGHPVTLQGDSPQPLNENEEINPNPITSSYTSSSHLSQASVHGQGSMSCFNFIICVDTPPDSHLSSHLEGYYRDIIVPVTATLKYLEKKDQYLGKESAKLRKLRESFADKGQTPLEHLLSLPSNSDLAAAISHLYNSLKSFQSCSLSFGSTPVEVILRGEIELENDFDPTFEEDGEDGEGSNSPTDFNRPNRPAPLFSKLRRKRVHFSPWESLLPLEEPEKLKLSVEVDSLLWRFLDIWSPTLSFAEYATLLDIEGEHAAMHEMVVHLLHWKKGRVIDVVSLRNCYALKADFLPTSLIKISPEFKLAFPSLPSLPLLLSKVSTAALTNASFSTIFTVQTQRLLYLTALIWLLRHEVLEKQKLFFRIIILEKNKRDCRQNWKGTGTSGTTLDSPSIEETGRSEGTASSTGARKRKSTFSGLDAKGGLDLKDARAMCIVPSSPTLSNSFKNITILNKAGLLSSSPLKGSGNVRPIFGMTGRTATASSINSNSRLDGSEESSIGTSILLEPGRPSTIESRWLTELCNGKDSEIVEKFNRIKRNLNGSHDYDEIRFSTGISRKEMRQVLEAFQDNLVQFYHP